MNCTEHKVDDTYISVMFSLSFFSLRGWNEKIKIKSNSTLKLFISILIRGDSQVTDVGKLNPAESHSNISLVNCVVHNAL